MNETTHYLLVFSGGIVLGVIFYGGLWLTIRKGLSSKHAALFLLASFFLRSGITLTGFYFLSLGDLTLLLLSIVGFISARLTIMRFTRSLQKEAFKKEAL